MSEQLCPRSAYSVVKSRITRLEEIQAVLRLISDYHHLTAGEPDKALELACGMLGDELDRLERELKAVPAKDGAGG